MRPVTVDDHPTKRQLSSGKFREAGRSDTLFSDDAVARLPKASQGLPRAVNNLAVQALIAAYAANASIVDDMAARTAVTEVTSE